MQRFIIRVSFFTPLLLIAACSQPPAMVDLKGQNTYGRNSYALNTPPPVYNYTGASAKAAAPTYTTAANNVTQTAGVQSVGVHDLAALSPAAGNAPPPINSWTGRPHFSAADSAPTQQSSAPSSQAKPIAQLDRIIGNDSSHPAKIVSAENATFMWPVSGKKIISSFGPKSDGKTNDGINIAANEGEPVWASADGEVVYVGNELQGYGNMVLIKHPGNKTTAYAHLSRAIVDKYDRVKQGDIIGYVGSTGNVKEPQLHFAIRDGKEPVDPEKYLSSSVASN